MNLTKNNSLFYSRHSFSSLLRFLMPFKVSRDLQSSVVVYTPRHRSLYSYFFNLTKVQGLTRSNEALWYYFYLDYSSRISMEWPHLTFYCNFRNALCHRKSKLILKYSSMYSISHRFLFLLLPRRRRRRA